MARMSGSTLAAPEQLRAARGLLGWTQRDLARAAGTSRYAIVDYENGRVSPYVRTLQAIVAALERAGVEFTAETADAGPGVRLRK